MKSLNRTQRVVIWVGLLVGAIGILIALLPFQTGRGGRVNCSVPAMEVIDGEDSDYTGELCYSQARGRLTWSVGMILIATLGIGAGIPLLRTDVESETKETQI